MTCTSYCKNNKLKDISNVYISTVPLFDSRFNMVQGSVVGNSHPYNVLSANTGSLGYHKQRLYYKIYDHPLVQEQFYFSQCVHNEQDALENRHHLTPNWKMYIYKDNMFPDDGIEHERKLYRKLYRIRIRLAEQLGNFYVNDVNMPFSREHIIDKLKSGVKKRYILANKQINDGRLYNFEGKAPTMAFIKWEKMDAVKMTGTARLIQFKSYKFTLFHKQLLQPLVDADKVITEDYYHQPFNTIRTSGMSQIECAEVFKREWDSLKRPASALLDCSKFDGHVDFCQLELELIVLQQAYAGKVAHQVFDKLMYNLFKKSGYTQHGIKYKADGSRDSGVASTAKGNSDINHVNLRTVILFAISKFLGIDFFKMTISDLKSVIHYLHVHGDDSVIIAESEFVKVFENVCVEIMKCLGHDVKISVVYDFEQISYCQCSPINMGTFYKMVREPIRSISRGAYSEKEQPWPAFYAAIGLCELAVHSGVPILQSLGISHIVKSGLTRPLRTYQQDTTFSGSEPAIISISEVTRWSFYRAFGIHPEEQVVIERSMAPDYTNITNHYIEKHKNFTHYAKKPKVQ